MTTIQADVEAAIAAQPIETAEQRADRYERAIKAIGANEINGADFGDWVQMICTDVLEGLEATCSNCGTFVHDGACVSEDGGGD